MAKTTLTAAGNGTFLEHHGTAKRDRALLGKDLEVILSSEPALQSSALHCVSCFDSHVGCLDGRALRPGPGKAVSCALQSKKGPAFLDNFRVISCVSWAAILGVYRYSGAGL